MLSRFTRSAFTVGIFVVSLLLVTTATGNLVYFVAFLLGLVLFAVPYHYKARRDKLVEWFGFVGSPAQDEGILVTRKADENSRITRK